MSTNKRGNWWQRYPRKAHLVYCGSPRPQDIPRFQRGDRIRLKGKPGLLRRVLAIEWHSYRHEFVYIVETSDCDPSRVYWFYDQLILEIEPESVAT